MTAELFDDDDASLPGELRSFLERLHRPHKSSGSHVLGNINLVEDVDGFGHVSLGSNLLFWHLLAQDSF